MSEPKTTGTLVTAEVTWVSPVEYVEIRAALARSRAREKRLEGRLRTYVRDDECKYGMDGACDPGEPPCRFCSARAALSEEP